MTSLFNFTEGELVFLDVSFCPKKSPGALEHNPTCPGAKLLRTYPFTSRTTSEVLNLAHGNELSSLATLLAANIHHTNHFRRLDSY